MKDANQSKPVYETACTESHTGNVILHLSDLHFIKHNDEAVIAKNQNIQKDLLKRLNELLPDWKPNILCITGDISDKNNKEGYEQAQEFIENLTGELNIPPENIIICPGNHDFDRKKAARYFRNKTIEEAIGSFAIPISPEYNDIFSNYINFCRNLNIPECIYGNHSSYLFGLRLVNNTNFIVCNSSWYHTEKETQGFSLFRQICRNPFKTKQVVKINDNENWLCLSLLEYIECHHDILEKKQRHEDFNVGLLHHPERQLPEDEAYRRSKSENAPAAVYLAERVDLMLTGHMHGLPLGKTSFVSAPSINCGSTLKESSEDKAFYIVQVTDFALNYKSFKIDILATANKWTRDLEGTILTPQIYEKIVEYSNFNSLNQLATHLDDSISKKLILGKSYSKKATNVIEQIEGFSISVGDVTSLLDDIKKQLDKAERHIERLEFTDAFRILDVIEKAVEPLSPSTQSKTLSEIYARISLIECTRANCLHIEKGNPADYSIAKEYLKKAKKADGKL